MSENQSSVKNTAGGAGEEGLGCRLARKLADTGSTARVLVAACGGNCNCICSSLADEEEEGVGGEGGGGDGDSVSGDRPSGRTSHVNHVKKRYANG